MYPTVYTKVLARTKFVILMRIPAMHLTEDIIVAVHIVHNKRVIQLGPFAVAGTDP